MQRDANRSRNCIVLDPMADTGWPKHNCHRAKTMQELLYVAHRNTECNIVIDEAAQEVGTHPPPEILWLATQSRHLGHSVYFISQRGQSISKTVRDQCTHLFLFACSLSDAKIFADEKGEILSNAHMLPRGSFYHAPQFGEIIKTKLF